MTFTGAVGGFINPVVIALSILPPVCLWNTVVMIIHSSFGKVSIHVLIYYTEWIPTTYTVFHQHWPDDADSTG